MSYIYKITNNITGRMYIGATKYTAESRWIQHLADSEKDRCCSRPLYAAINKYGKENFSIEVIEECAENIAFEREIFWIDFYDTFRNGYNATFGGSGRQTIDYGIVYDTYKQLGNNCLATAEHLNIDPGNASVIIRALSGKEKLEHPPVQQKRIRMYSKSMDYLRTFSSSRDAARFLIHERGLNAKNEGGYSSHIIAACKGKRQSVGGYVWEYAS